MVNMTMTGDLKDWNCATMMRKMNTSATPMTSSMSSMIERTVSFSPERPTVQPAGGVYPASASSSESLTLESA